MNASRLPALVDLEAPAEQETAESIAGVWRRWLIRTAAVAGIAVIIFYPVRSLFGLDGIPSWLPWAWILAVFQALVAPRSAIFAFVAIAPLLAIVPSFTRWPPVSLGEAWLWALLVAGWVALAREPRWPTWPKVAMCWLLLTFASLTTVVYPLHLNHETVGSFFAEVSGYLSNDLIVAVSQRPALSPVLMWVVLAEGLGLLWVILLFFRRDIGSDQSAEPATRALVVTMAGTACVVGAWAVWQRWTLENLLDTWIELDPYIVRVNASFTDVNALGAYLASFLPVAIVLAFERRTPSWRWFWGVGSSLMALGVFFTASRAAWAAVIVSLVLLVAGVIAFGLTRTPSATKQLRRIALVGAVAFGLLVGSLTVWATVRDIRLSQQRSYADVLFHTLNLRESSEERFKGRPELWMAALRMMVARPLSGIGIGRYYKQVSAWTETPERLVRPQENAHNYFLQVGAETGVPGLVCFLLLLGGALFHAFRVVRSDAPLSLRRVSLALAAGIVGFAMTLLSGHSLLLREGQLTFWPLVAGTLLVGAAYVKPVRAGRRERWSWALVPCLILVLAVTLPARFSSSIQRLDVRLFGVYDPEQSPGNDLRWTGPVARIDIPAYAAVVEIALGSQAPFAQTVQIRHEDRVIERRTISPGQWVRLRYVMPKSRTREYFRRFELEVDPTWRPDGDPRELGIVLGRIDPLPAGR